MNTHLCFASTLVFCQYFLRIANTLLCFANTLLCITNTQNIPYKQYGYSQLTLSALLIEDFIAAAATAAAAAATLLLLLPCLRRLCRSWHCWCLC